MKSLMNGAAVAIALAMISAPASAAEIGFVGCSNTINMAGGAYELSGTGQIWAREDMVGYAGGRLREWARIEGNRDERWSVFETALALNPDTTSVVW